MESSERKISEVTTAPASSGLDHSSLPTKRIRQTRNGGPSMRSRQLDIALAMSEGGVLVPVTELRRRCKESGCLNEPNFTKYMRETSSPFKEVRQGKRIVGWQLVGAVTGPTESDTAYPPGTAPAPTDCLTRVPVAHPVVLNKENDDLVLVRMVEEENAALRRANALRTQEVEDLRAEAEAAKARLALLESRRATSAPGSVIECIDLVERVFDDRVVFLEKARASARAARINELPREMPNVLRCLSSIALHLHDIFFGPRRDQPGTPWQKFQELSGFELALTELHQTKANARLRDMRRIVYQGEKIDLNPHVKYGTTMPRLLRMHVGTHRRSRKLVVGWCGDHMETAGTHRMH